jgi:hypothetical protein
MKNSFIKIAKSHHGRCFICKRRTSLHKVKSESVLYALKHYKIYIKPHARCCVRHLDLNGLIKHEQFDFILTSQVSHEKNKKIILDNNIFFSVQSGIFENFRDMASLTDEYCFKITRWSKQEFIHFSKYITSIYDTAGRTKEELIAVYRYWLRKGLDQSSLALYQNNKSQHQISHYLSQIRMAINKDFVPFYLGSSKDIAFYLSHNNETTTILHNLKKNDLIIIVDSTYLRLEKSSNNHFQYKCWSQQKMDLLMKPFIICCADGFIIDCYGPFQANLNDAKIFEYILETDKSLLSILKPNNTVVLLDRGK